MKCPCNPKASVVSHVSGVLLIFARLAVGIPTIGTGERRERSENRRKGKGGPALGKLSVYPCAPFPPLVLRVVPFAPLGDACARARAAGPAAGASGRRASPVSGSGGVGVRWGGTLHIVVRALEGAQCGYVGRAAHR